jgi:hypothetical protein
VKDCWLAACDAASTRALTEAALSAACWSCRGDMTKRSPLRRDPYTVLAVVSCLGAEPLPERLALRVRDVEELGRVLPDQGEIGADGMELGQFGAAVPLELSDPAPVGGERA